MRGICSVALPNPISIELDEDDLSRLKGVVSCFNREIEKTH